MVSRSSSRLNADGLILGLRSNEVMSLAVSRLSGMEIVCIQSFDRVQGGLRLA